MRSITIMKHAVIIAGLLTLHPGCKIFHKSGKSGMDDQAKEIRANVPDVDVVEEGDGLGVAFKPTVLFEFDKADVPAQIKTNLELFAVTLMHYPDTRILIRGYTDDMGTESYNMSLSEQRAQRVKDYLISRGLSSSRMTIKGYGATAPKYPNDTEAGRAKNRRVEFLIMPK